MIYTIYGLIDPRKPWQVKYVGCTRNPDKRLAEHISASGPRGDDRSRWIHSLLKSGVEPRMRILCRARTKRSGLLMEDKWIKKLDTQLTNGRGCPSKSKRGVTVHATVSRKTFDALRERTEKMSKRVGIKYKMSAIISGVLREHA